jgi:hypothetical protein
VGNIDINLGGYFYLYFVMTSVGNLDLKLGGYFMYFFNNGRGGNVFMKHNRSNGYY